MESSRGRATRTGADSSRTSEEPRSRQQAQQASWQPSSVDLAGPLGQLSPAAILGMQARMGNRAVARFLDNRLAQREAAEADEGERVSAAPAVVQRDAAKGTGTGKGTTTFKPVAAKTYTVEAKTLKEAADQLGAREEAGETTWETTRMVTNLDDSGNVTSATVELLITVTMPSWPGAAGLNKAAKAEWDRAYKALKAHEDNHVKLAREKLKGVADKMIGKTESEAQTVLADALAELKVASDEYDTASDHGANEGTTIDTSAGSPP